MKRFLSTTAVLLTLSGGAYADAHATGFGDVTVQEGDFFASDLIGMRIYNSETEVDADAMVADGAETEWDDIGEINDVIISPDGQVTAVILGVGGFLGIGERDVSVSMDAIKVVREQGDSNDRFLVVTTSKEMLEKAPEFDRDLGGEMEQAAENAEAKTEEMAENAEAGAEEAVVAADTAMEREMLARPTFQRDGYQDVEWTEMTADDLEGARIYGVNDEDVGEIETLIVDDSGKITDVLADIGGFLGMGEHTVKLSFEELQLIRNEDGSDLRVYVDSTEEKLESLPEYEG
ncbi:PRC-barrel domain-containing protein [Sulfitobacter sp. MF3-043]|uniref:PRC-barrel domain-containing protein n=1 Tax=Sulfitobacter sediminivivens TaxID=3252902 RepID=UPI0036DF4404